MGFCVREDIKPFPWPTDVAFTLCQSHRPDCELDIDLTTLGAASCTRQTRKQRQLTTQPIGFLSTAAPLLSRQPDSVAASSRAPFPNKLRKVTITGLPRQHQPVDPVGIAYSFHTKSPAWCLCSSTRTLAFHHSTGMQYPACWVASSDPNSRFSARPQKHNQAGDQGPNTSATLRLT